MEKSLEFFIIALVALLITVSVLTAVPQVRAAQTTMMTNNESTSASTTENPTTNAKVQQPVQEEQQSQQPQDQNQQILTPNHAPRANAGPDKKVNEGAVVVLDASQSSDPDIGNKIIYSWRQIAGRPLVDLGLSSDASTLHLLLQMSTEIRYLLL